MANKQQGVQVDIYDHAFNLRSDAPEEYTRELALAVDEIIRSISHKTHIYDSMQLAVLAALHFADEYKRLSLRYEHLHEQVTEKSIRISQALDQVETASKTASNDIPSAK